MRPAERSRTAATIVVALVVVLLVVVAVASRFDGRSRRGAEARAAEAAAWDRAVADTGWLGSVGLVRSDPRSPCTVEDDTSGLVVWTGGEEPWALRGVDVHDRLVSEGWSDVSGPEEGYASLTRTVAGRVVVLSLATWPHPVDDVRAVLVLTPSSCGPL